MDVLVGFDSIPWQTTSPAGRFKVVVRGAQRVRLLELTEGRALLLLFEAAVA